MKAHCTGHVDYDPDSRISTTDIEKPVIVNLTLSEAKKTFNKLTSEDQHTFAHWAIERAHT